MLDVDFCLSFCDSYCYFFFHSHVGHYGPNVLLSWNWEISLCKAVEFSFNCFFFFFTLIMCQHLLTETVSNQSLMRKLLTSIFGNTNIFPFGTLACFWICKWQNFKVRLRKHFGGEGGLHFHYGIKKMPHASLENPASPVSLTVLKAEDKRWLWR